jgi:hypothetical protein
MLPHREALTEPKAIVVHPANALVGIEMKDMLISSEVVFNRLQRQEIKHVQEFTEP